MPPHPSLTDEIAECAALYALGLLSESERSSLDRHLAEGCSVCQAEVSRCGDLLASWALEMALSPPSSLRQKLLQTIHEKANTPAGPCSPVLLDKSGLMALRTALMEWKRGPTPGLWVKVLFDDPERDMTTTLVRMNPGALYPSHRHKGVEEVYILEGKLQVEGVELEEGDFCLSQPNTVHQGSYSKTGCLLVVKTSKRDEILH